MKPTEAIAMIRAAWKAVTNWNPDAEPWPDAAITAAHAAIVELVQYYAAMGRAEGHKSASRHGGQYPHARQPQARPSCGKGENRSGGTGADSRRTCGSYRRCWWSMPPTSG